VIGQQAAICPAGPNTEHHNGYGPNGRGRREQEYALRQLLRNLLPSVRVRIVSARFMPAT